MCVCVGRGGEVVGQGWGKGVPRVKSLFVEIWKNYLLLLLLNA